MKKTLFLLGMPDDAARTSVTETREGDGTGVTREASISGVLPITPFVMNDADLAPHSHLIVVGQQKFRIQPDLEFNLFNLVGDAETSTNLLRQIEYVRTRTHPRRCFNLPANILRTTREALPRTLAGIDRCQVARVKQIEIGSPEELENACEAFACWPLIIRAPGHHGGDQMMLIKDRQYLSRVSNQAWLSGKLLLIEYIDTSDDMGIYQKNRVIMVDGAPFIRHAICSTNWMIHSGSRADRMDQDLSLCHREKAFLQQMYTQGLKDYAEVFAHIHSRIGLDLFGIDFAIDSGRIVVFEANACMNFLSQNFGEDHRYDYLKPYMGQIQIAIRHMLMHA